MQSASKCMKVSLSGGRNGPFPHSAPVSKHKKMRSRLGLTISYKSLFFVHPNLDLMPLLTGMRERSMKVQTQKQLQQIPDTLTR